MKKLLVGFWLTMGGFVGLMVVDLVDPSRSVLADAFVLSIAGAIALGLVLLVQSYTQIRQQCG